MSSKYKVQKQLDEAKHQNAIDRQFELAHQLLLASTIIGAHDTLQVGPGRSDHFLQSILSTEYDIVDALNSDYKDDRSLVWTHAKIEESLKAIFGKDWEQNRDFFSMIVPKED